MGIVMDKLSPSVATRLLFSMRVDDYMTAFTPRVEARQICRADFDNFPVTSSSERLLPARESVSVPAARVQVSGYRYTTAAEIAEARKTWGLLPEHQRGLKTAVQTLKTVQQR